MHVKFVYCRKTVLFSSEREKNAVQEILHEQETAVEEAKSEYQAAKTEAAKAEVESKAAAEKAKVAEQEEEATIAAARVKVGSARIFS